MRTRTITRIRRAGATSVAGATALLLTLGALPASAASTDGEYLPVGFAGAGTLGRMSTDSSRAPGWQLPNGTTQDGEVTADGAFRLSNSGLLGFTNDRGYVTPALTTTAGEVGVGDVNTFDVGFTVDSATGAYQDGLSIGVSLDDAARGWSRYGGIVWFMHDDDVLKVGSFALETALNTATRPVPSAGITWTETVVGDYDPTVAHDIRLIGTYRAGLENDTIDIYVDGVHAATVPTFEGYHEVKNTAAKEVGSLSFFFGPGTASANGIPVFGATARQTGLAGDGFLFSDIVLQSYDVDLETPAPPTTLPPLETSPDGDLDAPASTGTDVDITVEGTGFDPFETVLLTANSTPVFLGWATADLTGTFRTTVKVPASVGPGTHTIQAVGQRSGWTVSRSILVTLPATGSDLSPALGAYVALGALAAGLTLTLAVGTRRRRVA